MTYYAGIDIGSLSTDTVIIDNHGSICGFDVSRTGADSKTAGERSLTRALEVAGIPREDLRRIVATGYGRASLPGVDKAVTEITCHAKGAAHLFPGTRTIIDIGGQDSKVIKLDGQGKLIDFAMNDKCAAGTGRFLEVMAKALEVDLDRMGSLSLQATREIAISSTCTVFAESEVISLVAQSTPRENILRGIHTAICMRVLAMMDRMNPEPELTITGGVAKNVGILDIIRRRTNLPMNVPDEPQIVGALGAALLAREQ